MKTQEERKAARFLRKTEQQEEKERFPAAMLFARGTDWGVCIRMEAGNRWWLDVSHDGKWRPGRIEGWTVAEILIDDPASLASFIHALTARYNAMVLEMNAHTVEPMLVAKVAQ